MVIILDASPVGARPSTTASLPMNLQSAMRSLPATTTTAQPHAPEAKAVIGLQGPWSSQSSAQAEHLGGHAGQAPVPGVARQTPTGRNGSLNMDLQDDCNATEIDKQEAETEAGHKGGTLRYIHKQFLEMCDWSEQALTVAALQITITNQAAHLDTLKTTVHNLKSQKSLLLTTSSSSDYPLPGGGAVAFRSHPSPLDHRGGSIHAGPSHCIVLCASFWASAPEVDDARKYAPTDVNFPEYHFTDGQFEGKPKSIRGYLHVDYVTVLLIIFLNVVEDARKSSNARAKMKDECNMDQGMAVDDVEYEVTASDRGSLQSQVDDLNDRLDGMASASESERSQHQEEVNHQQKRIVALAGDVVALTTTVESLKTLWLLKYPPPHRTIKTGDMYS
ncbi:hypothetical protein DFH27DRAFT_654825 [Peziza echinospora]|nr:hypothetical protein DFH27DRAFT_654825 [Peziza echinospora]